MEGERQRKIKKKEQREGKKRERNDRKESEKEREILSRNVLLKYLKKQTNKNKLLNNYLLNHI